MQTVNIKFNYILNKEDTGDFKSEFLKKNLIIDYYFIIIISFFILL